MPGDYLEHLNDLGLPATITADELRTAGLWQRTGGGYRLLDRQAVQACQDQRALAEAPEHQARTWP